MKKAILDGAVLAGDRTNAHVHLQRALDLPDYYGCNLDALYDCLNDEAGPLEILIRDCSAVPSGSYGARIVETICQATQEVGGHVILEYSVAPYEEMDESDE
ncbi:MAG: barstar family protein [Clostridia bacterium]|nr:barstar family protein [Clostridia bacterium]MBQ5760495.1 barstar family protein [Clostridia bacterium]